MIKSSDFQFITKNISYFFYKGNLTSSYKPIIFKGILYLLKKRKTVVESSQYFIKLQDLARYFFKFNFILYKRFHLKQLSSTQHDVAIYKIIDNNFAEDAGLKTPKKIPDESINETVKLLLRHVLFLLRKDIQIYDFYDSEYNLIELPIKIKDEGEFQAILKKKSLQNSDIYAIGLSDDVYNVLQAHRPILESALTANLSIFLEKLNTVPNLALKIMIADGSYHSNRNISDSQKQLIYNHQNNKCFYCGCDMEQNPNADHFIPYNYIFDSQIWNIVGACTSCNSKKSNFLVDEKYLKKIIRRNNEEEFLKKLEQSGINLEKDMSEVNAELIQFYQSCRLYFKKIDL